jgi:polar amino acid transport system permease protein
MGWNAIFASWRELLVGLEGTALLSVLSIITATVLGLIVALIRTAHIPVLSALMRIYLEIFRGSPLLIQMLFIYFGAAYLGFSGVTTLIAVVAALTLYEGALISEIFRAGFEAVPKGQREAARSLGLSRFSLEKDVVLPQAVKIVVAPLIGQYIGLVKDTSLATVVGFTELIFEGQAVIDRVGMPLQVFSMISLAYFIICYPMSIAARRLEKRMSH